MKRLLSILLFITASAIWAQTDINSLPVWKFKSDPLALNDWLVKKPAEKAMVYRSAEGKDIILFNGLVKRVFRITPNTACTEYKNLTNGQQLIRSVKPEAEIVINGQKYNIGGVSGQQQQPIY